MITLMILSHEVAFLENTSVGKYVFSCVFD